MLDGWKEIGAYLESITGKKRSRFTLMRWALRGMPVMRDPSNRPQCESAQLDAWWQANGLKY